MISLLLTVGPWAIFLLAWGAAAWAMRGRAFSAGVLFRLGVLWILLVQGESLLGPLARLEWGDGERLFQGYFPYLAEHANQRFLPDIMGGVDRYALGRIGGEYFSVRLLLLHVMPLWALTVLLRFAVSGVALAGMYLFCRRQIGATAEVAFALGMLFAVGFDFTATVTFLYGFSLAGMPLLLYALFARRWALFAAFGALYIGTADPIYWLPLLWVSALSLRLWTRPASDLRAFLALLALSVVWVANYAEMLLAFADMLPWSARGGAPSQTLLEAVKPHLDWMLGPTIGYNHGGPLFVLPVAAALIAGAVYRDRTSLFAASAALVVGLAPPFLATVPWTRLGLPFFASYRWYWEYGAFALALFAGARACAILQTGRWHIPRIVVGGAIGLAVAMLFVFKVQILLLTVTRGNLSTLVSIPNAVEQDWRENPAARVVGIPSRIDPNGLASAGLSTLDGGATLIHHDLQAFWSHGIVLQGPKPTREIAGFGQHAAFQDCCIPLDMSPIADLDLLRLANVGYIVSYRALRSDLLTQVSGPATQTKPSILDQILRPATPAFVYRLTNPFPLAYAATGVISVPDDIPLPALTEVLKREALVGKAVMAASVLPSLPAAEASTDASVRARWTGDGVAVELSGWQGGLLLVNIPYLPWWSARTGNTNIAIQPANLIQMALDVPAGTNTMHLDYRRPLLRDRLFTR